MFIRIAIPVALVLMVGYGLFRAFPLIEGPSIALSTPAAGAISTDGTVLVSGHVARVQNLTLDGAPLIPDENGAFSTTLALPAGPVILSLRATDRFGRAVTVTRTVQIETEAIPATTVATSSQTKL